MRYLIVLFVLIAVPVMADVDALIRVPDTTYWQVSKEKGKDIQIKDKWYKKSLSDKTLGKLVEKKAQYTSQDGGMLFNTRSNSGYMLIAYHSDESYADLEQMIKDESLDWTILAYIENGEHKQGYDPAALIDYLADVPVCDKDGNITGYKRPETATPPGCFQGRRFKTESEVAELAAEKE